MAAFLNSFDTLVSGITKEERRALLEKLQASAKGVEVQTMQSPLVEKSVQNVSILDELKQQSVFCRLWVFIRSFFTGESAADIYNRDKVAVMAADVMRTYPGLLDYRREFLLPAFYEKLKELKDCADFFKPYFEQPESDIGAFYAYLGILLMPEVTERMNTEADPFIYPVVPTVTKEHRTALMRKMEEILREIEPVPRKTMYEGVIGFEWFRQFVRLPFEHFLNVFTNFGDGGNVCMFADVGNELALFAKVLCAGKTVTGELLQALYLYSKHEQNDEELQRFLSEAQEHLSVMHVFISTVPCHPIAAIVYNDSAWQPEVFGGAEDWFVKYREEWRKVFDRRWTLWLQSCRKEAQRQTLHAEFGLESFPLLPSRPWASLWGGVLFRYELTAGFIYWFMENKYAGVVRTLKTLLLNGIFSYKENKEELISGINVFSRIELEIKQFGARLSRSGEVGLLLDKLSGEQVRTLQGQRKVDAIMSAAEKEVMMFQSDFCETCRSFVAVLTGAFDESTDKKYGSVKNLRLLRTQDNHDFCEELRDLKTLLQETLEMIIQIEGIDATVVRPQEVSGVR